MATRWLAALLIAGCAADVEPRTVPSDDVLCEIWAGNTPRNQHELKVYGTLSTDVIAAWGEPSARAGNVWTYEWAGETVALTFEEAALCYDGGKNISGLWVLDIDGDISEPCWNYDARGDVATCDGCIEPGGVSECL